MLEEIRTAVNEDGEIIDVMPYKAAESGEGLPRIGGREWVKQQEEINLSKRFEKMVGRPTLTGELFRYVFPYYRSQAEV